MTNNDELHSAWKRAAVFTAIIAVLSLTIVVVWMIVAVRPTEEARAAAQSSADVAVQRDSGVWFFQRLPANSDSSRALIIFPASLVDPKVYAPLAQAAARQGSSVYVIELPRRGLFGGSHNEVMNRRVARVLPSVATSPGWIAVAYGRGGGVASVLTALSPAGMAGVVLVGSRQPREIDLKHVVAPITVIGGTRDGLARKADVLGNRARLPSHTRYVWVEGGNHSQFAWQGYSPGDRPATITAENQRAVVTNTILGMLSTPQHAAKQTDVRVPVETTRRVIQATSPELAELRLDVPVRGVERSSLRDSYAEKRGQRQHDAIDILAPRGTPVLSATDGRVLKLFSSKAGGLMVYATDVSERFILMYGHLDSYEPGLTDGAKIVRGQVIGYVGTTGNAPAGTPHLHFAVLRGQPNLSWSRGTPVNPYPLLSPPMPKGPIPLFSTSK